MLSSAVYLNDNLNNLHQIRKTSCTTPSMLQVPSVFTPKNHIKTVPFYPIMKPPKSGAKRVALFTGKGAKFYGTRTARTGRPRSRLWMRQRT